MDTWWKAIGFYLIVCSLRIGLNQALQLCQNAVITESSINLDLNSSPITSSNGMCSCKITLGEDAKITMFASDIKSPECKTSILLSDTSFTFTCVNEKIDPVASYAKDLLAGKTLWVSVTSSGSLNPMSGTLQIKSKPLDTEFTLQCFEPNTNSTETTPIPISTTTTTVTTTVATSSTPPPTTTTTSSPTTTSDSPPSPVTVPPQQPSTTTTKTSSQQPQPTTTDLISTTHTENTTSDTGSTNSTTGSTPASTSGSTGVVAPVDDDDKEFPVGAVVGGILGGVAFIIIIIILIAVCLRRRRKEPSFLESGQKQSKGHKNKGYDNGVPNIRNMPKHSLYESTPVNLENGQRSNDAPRQNEPLDNDDLVEGSEVVVTSSGDIYAVVDKSNPERNSNISPSGDVYASVNKPKKPNVTFSTDPRDQSGTSDSYAPVDKSRPHYDEDEEAAISRMMRVPDKVLQERISSVQSTAL